MPPLSAPTTAANSPLLLPAVYNHAPRPLLSSSHHTSFFTSPSSPFASFQRKRVLMPTTRRSFDSASPKPAFMKSPTHKFSRSRSGSTSLQSSPEPTAFLAHNAAWAGAFCPKFEIVEEQIEMEGYQMYAVEKWLVDRARPVTVLIVYTGDPKHKINVTAFALLSSLSQTDVQSEWEKSIQTLRRDGARPKETDKGVLMVTSLANFRSDLTIVQIPCGNLLEVLEQLHTNINLLRMGCSGRSALTLQEPSDTTKDKFISMYYVQDKVRSKELFNTTVLELVKFIQSCLAIFGIFDMGLDRNGLLCDATVDGIQRWIIEIGEPYVHVEPTERLADPSVVSALLSLVLTMRNKLYDIGFGQVVPRDPFLDPLAFVSALTIFHNSRHNISSGSSPRFATGPMIDILNAAHDKFRQVESYKVHRVLKSKLDDLTTDLRTTSNDALVSTHAVGATPELNVFVKAVLRGGKDGAASLRYLWSGRPLDICQMKEKVHSDGEKEDEYEKEKYERVDGKSTDDEPEFLSGIHWSGRVQRKLESWTALGRNKKTSVDLGPKGWSWMQPTESAPPSVQIPSMPTVVISREGEDDEVMSSGQTSPVWEQQTAASSAFAFDRSPTAGSSVPNLTEYERRVTEFNQKRPQPTQYRIVSWSDPISMRGIARVPSQAGRTESSACSEGDWDNIPDISLGDIGEQFKKKPLNFRLQRRRSFSDLSGFQEIRTLPLDRMKIDVELCGQLLIMRRREIHLQNAVACLRELTHSLSERNTHLREEYQAHACKLQPFLERGSVINDIESARIKADAITQETRALQYESQQFRVGDLWQTANPPRQKVLELRDKIFGTGRKLPQGVSGAYGRFNRVQWTLDSRGRLVDWLGRTESEVEEESGLEDVIPPREPEEDEDAVEHPELKPTWLLKFFNNWGNRWGTGIGGTSKKTDERSPPSSGSSSPIDMSPKAQHQ